MAQDLQQTVQTRGKFAITEEAGRLAILGLNDGYLGVFFF
jgi:hypothetical protein